MLEPDTLSLSTAGKYESLTYHVTKSPLLVPGLGVSVLGTGDRKCRFGPFHIQAGDLALVILLGLLKSLIRYWKSFGGSRIPWEYAMQED